MFSLWVLVVAGDEIDQSADPLDLCHHLSAFMTLAPGDVILTGTPEGLVDVQPGDEVVTEIEGIGRLVNFIAGDDEYPK